MSKQLVEQNNQNNRILQIVSQLKVNAAMGITSEIDQEDIESIMNSERQTYKFMRYVDKKPRISNEQQKELVAKFLWVPQMIVIPLLLRAQINAIIEPVENSNERLVNIVFTILSLINVTIFLSAFKYKRYKVELLFLNYILLQLRFLMDFYDIDQSNVRKTNPNGRPEPQDYDPKFLAKRVFLDRLKLLSLAMHSLYSIFFWRVKYINIYIIVFIINFFAFLKLSRNIDVNNSLLIFVIWQILIEYFGYQLNYILQNMQNNIDSNQKFKEIFDNIDESVIIIQPDMIIEYANFQFQNLFSKEILSVYNRIEQDPLLDRNCANKIINYFRMLLNYFLRKKNKISKPNQKSQLLDSKIFKNQAGECMSLIDLLGVEQIKEMSFTLNNTDFESMQHFQIKISQVKSSRMIQIVDTTISVILQEQKSQNKLLSAINATVSHELRNPINSIMAINTKNQILLKKMKLCLESNRDPQTIAENIKAIMSELEEGNKIQNCSTNLITFLVQDLLDFAQINSSNFRQNLSKFNIIDAVNDVMSLQKVQAESKGITLKAVFKNFRPGENNAFVILDENRIKQVLLNLQSNAVKYTSKGSVIITVQIVFDEFEEDKYLQISVIDTGPGITEENQKKLFKLFGYMNDADNSNQHGIGLGLVISEQIVKQYGGNITLTSTPGKGSCFSFTAKLVKRLNIRRERKSLTRDFCNSLVVTINQPELHFQWQPLKPILNRAVEYIKLIVRNDDLEVTSVLSDPGTERQINKVMVSDKAGIEPFDTERSTNVCEGKLTQKRILIVDDEQFNIIAAKIIVERAGFKNTDQFCISALNGQQAIEMIEQDIADNGSLTIGLILMDQSMPVMDGNTCTLQIRELLYSLGIPQPIISGCSGQVDQVFINSCISHGMNQVMSKPLNYKVLQQLLQSLNYI